MPHIIREFREFSVVIEEKKSGINLAMNFVWKNFCGSLQDELKIRLIQHLWRSDLCCCMLRLQNSSPWLFVIFIEAMMNAADNYRLKNSSMHIFGSFLFWIMPDNFDVPTLRISDHVFWSLLKPRWLHRKEFDVYKSRLCCRIKCSCYIGIYRMTIEIMVFYTTAKRRIKILLSI